MNQGTKIAVGVGVVGVLGFMYLNGQKKKTEQEAVLLEQRAIVANPKLDFAPVEIKPLELKPIVKTKDQIFQSVLNTLYPTQAITLPKTIAPSINKNLILKLGSKGAEVRELQRLLGFKGKGIDGIFGKNTLSALKAKKHVSQITLNKF